MSLAQNIIRAICLIMRAHKVLRTGASAKVARQSQTHPPKRILVVEDEPDISLLVTESLRESGYQVDATADGLLALRKLKTDHFDLLIVEDELPTVSGQQLVKALRLEFIMIPAILVLGTALMERPNPNTWPQIQAILFKPYNVPELLVTVKQVLREAAIGANSGFGTPSNWQSPICSRWVSGLTK
jgi:DNA-binding response OmpR family regulator